MVKHRWGWAGEAFMCLSRICSNIALRVMGGRLIVQPRIHEDLRWRNTEKIHEKETLASKDSLICG